MSRSRLVRKIKLSKARVLLKHYLYRFLSGDKLVLRHDIYLVLLTKFIQDNDPYIQHLICPICKKHYFKVSAYIQHLDEHGVFDYIVDKFSSLGCEIHYYNKVRNKKRIFVKCARCRDFEVCTDVDVYELWKEVLKNISFKLS